MHQYTGLFFLQLLLLFFLQITACQGQKDGSTTADTATAPPTIPLKAAANDYDPYFVQSHAINTKYGPTSITRNILQDQEGAIWMATWEGIIRYDGQSFTNMTNKFALRRFHTFSVLEDRRGHIWFGSIGGGLYRYDPSREPAFTNFTTEDGLASNSVTCIYEDRKGRVWFGTGGGLSCYDPSLSTTDSIHFQNFTTADGMTDDDINAILEDETGQFWIGTRTQACTYDGQTFSLLTTSTGQSFTNVRSIIQDRQGRVWFGGNDGFWRYDQKRFTQIATEFTGYIYEDAKENIWISAAVGLAPQYMTLYRYPAQMLAMVPSEVQREEVITLEGLVFGIEEDSEGGIWFGTLNGVGRYAPNASTAEKTQEAFNYFRPPPVEQAKPAVEEEEAEWNPLQAQRKNIIGDWANLSTNQQSLDTFVFLKNGTFNSSMNPFAQAKQWRIKDIHHLLIGETAYRFYFKKTNLVIVDQAGRKHELVKQNVDTSLRNSPRELDGQISTFVRRIHQDHKGHLWLGTNGDGVARYDRERLTYFSINEGFGGVAVRGIVSDAAGNVWFGTSGGLTKYDGQAFTNFTVEDGLAHDDIWSMTIDRQGVLWVGTFEGISRINTSATAKPSFTSFALPEGKYDPNRGVSSSRIVHSILEDSQGRLWFGTGQGAYAYDPRLNDGTGQPQLIHLSEKDGLCNNSVNCILEDDEGEFWFATHYGGVCRWDGKSFTAVTEQDGVRGTEAWDLYKDSSGNVWFPIEHSGVYRYDGQSFTNFNKTDKVNGIEIQCTFEDQEGRFWLGGVTGLFRYDGRSIFSVTRQGPWE